MDVSFMPRVRVSTSLDSTGAQQSRAREVKTSVSCLASGIPSPDSDEPRLAEYAGTTRMPTEASTSVRALSGKVHPRLLNALCYGSMMCLAISINLLPVFLTTLSGLFGGEGGLSKEQLGRLGAAVFSGLSVGIIVAGPLVDRWGAKLFALIGNGSIGASLCLLAWAPDYGKLVIFVGLLGFGAGVLDVVLSPVVAALHPERRSSAMNWLHSFYSVGAAVTIGAATLALGSGISWKASCLVLAGLPFLLVLAFLPLDFPVLVAEGQRVRLRTLIRRRWFVVAAFAIFLGAATELSLAQWLAGYAELALDFSRSTSGWALFVFSVVMAVGRMTIGALGNRVDGFNLMLWSSCGSVVLFLGGAFLPVPEWALAACVFSGFTVCCFWPTMLVVSANEYPMAGASMYGGLAIIGNGGGILMPWLIGWVGDVGNLHVGLAVAALAPLMMIPAVLVLRVGRSDAVTVIPV